MEDLHGEQELSMQNAYKKDSKASFSKFMDEIENHQIEVVGREIRKMMWPDSTEK